MYCKNCGKEVDGDSKFCPYCGTNIEPKVRQPAKQTDFQPVDVAPASSTSQATAAPVENKPPKVWTVFARISKILGIVCLSTSIIPYLNYFSLALGVVGIVMACLGKKALTKEALDNCNLGLKLSIAAVAVSIVMIIAFFIVLIVVLEQTAGVLASYQWYF